MTWIRQHKFLLLLLLALLGLVLAVLLLSRSSLVLNRIVRKIAISQLEKQLKHPVTIAEITGNLLTGLQIRGLEVADRSPERPRLVTVDGIDVRYKILPLIRRRLLLTDVILSAPTVHAERDAEGRLNLQELVPEPSAEPKRKSPLRVLVSHFRLNDGQFILHDAVTGAVLTIGEIYGRMDGPQDRWEHSGEIEVRDGRIEMNGVEKQFDEFRTTFEVGDDRGELSGLRVALGNSVLQIKGKLVVPPTAPGEDMDRSSLETQLALKLDFADFARFLPSEYQVEGVTDLAINAGGSISQPSGEMSLAMPFAKMNQFLIENLVTKAEFTPKGIQLTEFRGDFASGTLGGSGDLELTPDGVRYSGQVKLADLAIEHLLTLSPQPLPLPLEGRLGISFEFRGESQDPASLGIDGTVTMQKVIINGVALDDSQARFTVSDDQISMDANLDRAQIEMEGTIGLTTERNLKLQVQGVRLGRIGSILALSELKGSASLTASSRADVLLSATLRVTDAMLRDVPLGTLSADFRYTPDKILEQSIRLENGNNQLVLESTAQLLESIPIQLTFTIPSLQLGDYAALAVMDTGSSISASDESMGKSVNEATSQPTRLFQGQVTGQLTVRGVLQHGDDKLPRLSGQGNFAFSNVQIQNVPLDPFEIPLLIEGTKVSVPDLTLSIGGQKIHCSASADLDTHYQMSFESEPMSVARLMQTAGIQDMLVDAVLSLQAEGAGTFAEPEVHLTAGLSEIAYQSHPLGNITLHTSYLNQQVSIDANGFGDALSITGQAEIGADMPYEIDMLLSNWNLTPFIQAAQAATRNSQPTTEFRGLVDGHIHLSGLLSVPESVTAQVTLPELVLGIGEQRVLNRLPIDIAFANEQLHIRSFVLGDARDEMAYLSIVDGRIDIPISIMTKPEQNPLHLVRFDELTVQSDGFALEHLLSLMGEPPPVSGSVRYQVAVNGTVSEPDIQVNWSLPAVEIQTEALPEPFRLSELVGKAEYAQHRLSMEQIRFAVFGNPVELQGMAQLDLGNPWDSKLDVKASISSFDLAPLTTLSPQLRDLQGKADFHLALTGSLAHPSLSSRFQLLDTMVQPAQSPIPVDGLQVDVTIKGSEAGEHLLNIDLVKAEWQIAGSTFSACGRWWLPKTDDWSTLIRSPDRGTLGTDMAEYVLGNMHYSLTAQSNDMDIAALVQAVSKEKQTTGTGPSMGMENRNIEGQEGRRESGTTSTSKLLANNLISEGHLDAELKINGHGARAEQVSGSLVIDDLRVDYSRQIWQNLEPIRLSVASGKIGIDSLEIGGDRPWLLVEGSLDMDGDLDVQATVDALPLAALGLIHPDKPSASDERVSSLVRLEGNLSDPVVTANWNLRTQLAMMDFGNIGKATYQGRLLSLRNATRVGRVGRTLTLNGYIPLDLSAGAPSLSSRFLERPISVVVRAESLRLDPFADLIPLLDEAHGEISLEFGIAGTTADPRVRGQASLSDGFLKLRDVPHPLSAIELDLRTVPGKLDLQKFGFQWGLGRYDARAWLRMDGLLPIELMLEKFQVARAQLGDFVPAEVAEKVSGEVTAQASMHIPLNSIVTAGSTPWTPVIHPSGVKELPSTIQAQLTFDTVLLESGGRRIANPAPIEFRFENQQVRLTQQTLLVEQTPSIAAEKRFALTGFALADLPDSMEMRLEASNFDVGFFGALMPPEYAVNSLLHATLDVTGPVTSPQVTLNWDSQRLVVNSVPVDRFSGGISYRDKLLLIGNESQSLWLSFAGNDALFSATIPLGIPSLSTLGHITGFAVDGRLDANVRELDFLPQLLPVLGKAQGRGEVHLTFGGKVGSPQVRGVATADDIQLEIPESFINVTGSHARFVFTERNLEIERFDGRLNEGAYEVTGAVQWLEPRSIDLALNMPQGFTYHWPGLYEQIKCRRVNAAIRGPISVQGDMIKLPPIRGTVEISSGRYMQDWQQIVTNLTSAAAEIQTEVAFEAPIIRDLAFDLDVIIPDGFMVVSKLGNLNLELSALGKVVGPIKKPIFNGRVDLLQGDFSFVVLKPPFEITEGSFVENRSDVLFDPSYEIHAQTKEPISGVALVTTDGQLNTRDVEVRASITGKLSQQPQTQFSAEVRNKGITEEYQLTQPEILSLLALGRIDPTFAQASESEGNAFSNLLLGQSEKLVSRQLAQTLGLRGLEFDLDFKDIEQSEFTLTKALSSRLSLTYASTFDLHGEPLIGIQYQLRRNLAISGERNEQGKYGVGLKIEAGF